MPNVQNNNITKDKLLCGNMRSNIELNLENCFNTDNCTKTPIAINYEIVHFLILITKLQRNKIYSFSFKLVYINVSSHNSIIHCRN